MASTPFYDAQFTAGEKLTATRLNAEQAALQAEFERRSSHLTGFVPASGAPTLAIVGTTVTCTDLDVLLAGVRLTTAGTWDLTSQWQYDDTYYLELGADNGYQLEVSHQAGQIQIGTVVMASGVLSSLTVTVTAFDDTGSGSGDMAKSVYDSDDDGKVDTAELADAVVADGVTGEMLHPDVAGDGLVQDASGNLDVDVDGATIVIAQSGKLAVPAGGIGTAHIANDAVIPSHLSSSDTPATGDYVRIAADGTFVFEPIPAGTGDMRRVIYDTDNDGIVDHAALANSVPANAISSYQIADGSVLEDKIGTYAVTEDKIAGGAVTTNKIDDGAITDIKISPDGISGSRIAANSIPVDALAALGAPDDADVLTYDSSYNKYEWVGDIPRNTHDHTEGAGGQIPADGIASGAITAAKLQPASTPNDGQLLAYASTGTTLAWVDAPTAGLGEEAVRDLMGSTLVAGTNVTVTVDDVANTITIAATVGSGGLTAEEVHDLIDAHVLGTADQIVATASDVDDTLTLSLAEAVTTSLSDADGHVAIVAGNPHGTTAADVGAAADDHDHDGDYAAADHDHSGTYIPVSEKGAANGVASLGADGKVPAAQLPDGTGGGSTGTLSKGFVMLTPAASMDFNIWKPSENITITGLSVEVLDGTSVEGSLPTIMAADVEFETGSTDITTFADATVTAGTWIAWQTTAVVGVVSAVSATITYTVDA
jgi:hypothetical protein